MNKINPNHRAQNAFLKTFGPLVLLVGIVFLAIGTIDFFVSSSNFQSPKYFWCCFVGIPITFFGAFMTKMAYMGKVARYSAAELAPVAKDTFNYVANESAEGISSIAQALKETPADGSSIEARITKLDELRKKGIINDEDFEEQKDRILSEL